MFSVSPPLEYQKKVTKEDLDAVILDLSFRCFQLLKSAEMLGRSLTTSVFTSNATACLCPSSADCSSTAPTCRLVTISFHNNIPQHVVRGRSMSITLTSKKWKLHSASQIENAELTNEDKEKWEACREALTIFGFSDEEKDKILGKAFGHIHSPFWTEERKKEVPSYEAINQILNYLRSLRLTDDDICKVLKKFPELLGCSLENEVEKNVQILEKAWGIEGKSLRNVLLRNPKVLGYTVDCKGDCIAQCTRCWARF